MTIVSTRDFRSNQTKYLGMASRGERVILRSRMGSFHLTPVAEEPTPTRDITTEICNGLKAWREYLDGDKTKMHSAEELLHELRNSDL
mgnify:FL=1